MADLSNPSLLWLAAVATVAGLVRGFSGFGTALIYVPLAGMVLPPIWVLITLTIMDLIGPLPNLPRALRDGRPREVLLLTSAALAGLIPGLWFLDRLSPDVFRWIVSALCLFTVVLMASGWRWQGRMTPPVIASVGATSGLLGGISGLSGPPVILTYMAAPLPAKIIRANVLMFLVFWDVLFGATLWARGDMALAPVILGAALIVPYLAANVAGARLFRAGDDTVYRRVAYALIAAAAVASLPLWSQT